MNIRNGGIHDTRLYFHSHLPGYHLHHLHLHLHPCILPFVFVNGNSIAMQDTKEKRNHLDGIVRTPYRTLCILPKRQSTNKGKGNRSRLHGAPGIQRSTTSHIDDLGMDHRYHLRWSVGGRRHRNHRRPGRRRRHRRRRKRRKVHLRKFGCVRWRVRCWWE